MSRMGVPHQNLIPKCILLAVVIHHSDEYSAGVRLVGVWLNGS